MYQRVASRFAREDRIVGPDAAEHTLVFAAPE